ncbi:MAG: hypothetical protein L0Y32_02025 [Nevskiales bacterium]|nr:hypothetical protein [Nevskiales bacterium]
MHRWSLFLTFAMVTGLLGGLGLRVAAAPRSSPGATVETGDRVGTITVDGHKRTYRLHRPGGLDPRQRYPLVMVLHGTLGTGKKVSEQTGFSAYADRERFFVVYPDAIGNWNDGRATSKSAAQGIDDVSFITALVLELSGTLSVDPSRVYVTGVSSGGIMTYRLGCEASTLFAALAPVIANVAEPVAGRCAPATPIALVTVNGLEDPLVPFNGGDCCKTGRGSGEGGRVASHEASVSFFARRNGCSLSPGKEHLPALVQDGTSAERWTYPSCREGGEVISYVVKGGGHAWFSRSSAPRLMGQNLTGRASQNLDTTQVVWEFFRAHSRIGLRPEESPTP